MNEQDIAIIGMAGQFPQSSNLDIFWENLCKGKELITFFSDEDLIESGINPLHIKDTNYVKAKGLLEDTTCFDAHFFEYSPREAEYIDPQQRKLLEWAWTALEMAGYTSEQTSSLIGVFVGSSLSSYFLLNLFPYLQNSIGKNQDEMLMVLGNEKDFLATRISYKMNLKGPSKSIQTACSSSLVAVHSACQSLLQFECDIALAGGVSITFPEKAGYFYSKEGITSRDGHCRAFDHQSTGTLSGNGGGIIVLKRLEEALNDGDTIHAVIKGGWVGNDGNEKIGFTAPSIKGQAFTIASAQMNSEISPENISYVECHGTGTILGDPIEIAALTDAFSILTKKKQFCAVGSVKTNIGHLDAAAGIAGLIKTVLSLKARLIPPTLHFEKANPKINFDQTPFFVNSRLTPWVSTDGPLRAGVSSFGIGGTNAHIILEEAPKTLNSHSSNASFIFPFSAKTKETLLLMIRNFQAHLSKITFDPADIAYTLQVGRKQFTYRICFVCSSFQDLHNAITKYLSDEITPNLKTYSVAEQWMKGEFIDWARLYKNEKRKRVPLPTYPFSKTHYFIPALRDFTENLTAVKIAVANQNDISLEEQLILIWKKVLKTEKLSVKDDFFNLGGDSLLALEITQNIRENFGIEINLEQLFDNPTIENLTFIINETINKDNEEFSPAISN